MKFLVSKEKVVTSVLFVLFLYWLGLVKLLLVFLLVASIVLFFTRIRPPEYKGETAYKEGIFYSPVNGHVIGLTKSSTHNLVTVLVPWWRSCGLYLPMKSELEQVENGKGEKCFRYLYSADKEYSFIKLLFRSNDFEYSLTFVKCLLGSWPAFYMNSGDKGKALARMGHYLLGGVVSIAVPLEVEVVSKAGEKLFAGETIMARKGMIPQKI